MLDIVDKVKVEPKRRRRTCWVDEKALQILIPGGHVPLLAESLVSTNDRVRCHILFIQPLSIIIIHINLSNLDVVNVNYSSDISNSLEERSKAQEGILNYLLRCVVIFIFVLSSSSSVWPRSSRRRGSRRASQGTSLTSTSPRWRRTPRTSPSRSSAGAFPFWSVYFQTLSTLTHVSV